jgi:hypothetical protein
MPIKLDGSRLDQPWAALDVLFRSPSVALLIAGPGGVGKTTLACRIGRHALGEKGTPPGGFLCLPLLIDRNLEPSDTKDGFVPFLAGALRAMIGIPRLSTKLAEALLRSGRVLVIVDGLSERNDGTRRAFDPSRPNFPIMRLIVTSRDVKYGSMRSVRWKFHQTPSTLLSPDISIVTSMRCQPRKNRNTPAMPTFLRLVGSSGACCATTRQQLCLRPCGPKKS